MTDNADNIDNTPIADEFPIPEGFNSRMTEIDGIRIHSVQGGQGPLALLVHGFGQAWYEWHQLMPALAERYTVVAIDLPGLGLSEPPRTSFAGHEIARTIHRFAKTLSPDVPFTLITHDIGIWNTWPMVVAHEADIACLVHMEAPIPDARMYDFPAFSPEGESLVWHFSFFAAGNRLAETLVTGHEKFFLTHFITQHATNKSVFDDTLMDRYAASYAKPHTLNASFEYYRAINESIRYNQAQRADKVALPVLAIGGGGHGGMGQFQIDQMQEYASDVEGHVIPNAGHWLPEEAPEALNALILDFLTRRGPA